MSVQKLRIENGWSQERLAQISGLSLRTIQRIESGNTAGLESLNCLAAAFDTDIANLRQEPKMTDSKPAETSAPSAPTRDENEALDYVQNIRGLKLNFICFIILLPLLYLLNVYLTPDELWVQWVLYGWGAGLILQAAVIFAYFGLYGRKWERQAIEKRMSQQR